MDCNRDIVEIETEELVSLYLENKLTLDTTIAPLPDVVEPSIKNTTKSQDANPQLPSDFYLDGHIYNLSLEQTRLLYKLWNLVLKFSEQIEHATGIHELEEIFKLHIKVPNSRYSTEKTKKNNSFSLPSFRNLMSSFDIPGTNLSSTVSEPIISMSSDVKIDMHTLVQSAIDEFWLGLLGNFSEPDVALLRFLRARKWNLEQSFSMFIECLYWRWKNNVLSLMRMGESAIPSHLLSSGKTFFHGVDKSGHLLIFVLSKKHDKRAQTSEENEKYTIYHMELARRLLGKGMEKTTIVFDLNDAGYNSLDISSMKHLITCFQSNYPESLNRCFILNAPWIFWAFWTLISPLLDPVVASKITFIKNIDDLYNYLDKENIPARILPEAAYCDDNSPFIFLESLQGDNFINYWDDTLVSSKKQFQKKTTEIYEILHTAGRDSDDSVDFSNLLRQRNKLQGEYKYYASRAVLKSYSKNIYERYNILDHDDPFYLDWTKKVYKTE